MDSYPCIQVKEKRGGRLLVESAIGTGLIFTFPLTLSEIRVVVGVKLVTWRMATVLWMVVIFILSSIPSMYLGPDALPMDILKKVLHFIIFGILSVLYLIALKPRIQRSAFTARTFYISFVFTVIYAISDEYHQAFSSGRHSSLYDVIIDAGGAIVFLSSLYIVRKRKAVT